MAPRLSTTHSNDTVRLVMSTPAVTLAPDTTLRTAATVLRDHDIGAAAVVAPGGLVGVLSERDLVRALADGRDPDRTRVRDAMTGTPFPIEADSPLWAAAMLMLRHGIRHLPVVDDDRVVGMVSIREALAVMEHDRIVAPPTGPTPPPTPSTARPGRPPRSDRPFGPRGRSTLRPCWSWRDPPRRARWGPSTPAPGWST
ncbi:MAG TPA: CBS domain-containing protein [Acidimicrobiales bacterium]